MCFKWQAGSKVSYHRIPYIRPELSGFHHHFTYYVKKNRVAAKNGTIHDKAGLRGEV